MRIHLKIELDNGLQGQTLADGIAVDDRLLASLDMASRAEFLAEECRALFEAILMKQEEGPPCKR